MSDLTYGNCYCLLYQINILGVDTIMPFSLCHQSEEFLWFFIPLRDILSYSWPKSSISVLGTFTRHNQLSSAVQCYTSVACNIYQATHKGASGDITVANDSQALAMNHRDGRRWRAQWKKILCGLNDRHRERVFKSATNHLNTAATLHI